jgi:acetolactate synthase-1/2/3 large subunit
VPTISIGSAPPYVACTHVHTDDLRTSLRMLTNALTGHHRPTGIRVPDLISNTELKPPTYDGPGVRYRDAMNVLDRLLPDEVDIVVDVGNAGAAAVHYLPVRRGGRFTVALAMGYSFGAGIGMAFGHNKTRTRSGHVIVIAGDGAFFMHGMEIHTAIHHQLPITFVLLNNNAHAMGAAREQLFYGNRYSYNRFAPSQLGAGLAAMHPGLPATDVTDTNTLHTAIHTALHTHGPSVISIECAADEIPPFTPFLTPPKTKTITCHNPTLTKEHKTHATASA